MEFCCFSSVHTDMYNQDLFFISIKAAFYLFSVKLKDFKSVYTVTITDHKSHTIDEILSKNNENSWQNSV